MVAGAGVGDAGGVFGRGQLLVADLRSCPICGSSAISDVEMQELGLTRTRWLLCCGQCQATRAYVVRLRHARALGRALERALESDRQEILRAARRAERADATAGTEPRPNAVLNLRRTS